CSFAGTVFTQHWRSPCQTGYESNLVAPVVKLLVVDRSIPNRKGGSLDRKDSAADANAERSRHCGVGADGFQPVFGFHQRRAVFSLQKRVKAIGSGASHGGGPSPAGLSAAL